MQSLKEELSAMKRELSAEREAADEKLVNKLKLEKAPVFRKKGHEKQYICKEEVKMLSDASSALSEAPEEGEKLINIRQKHITRTAKGSNNGWATVEEYVEDAGVPYTLAKLVTYYCILHFGY